MKQFDSSLVAHEMCRVGASLFNRGYVHATAGNISAWGADGEALITASDACLGELRQEHLARVSADGHGAANARPSKALALHRAVVQAARTHGAPDTACVLHTHSTACVTLSLRQPTGGNVMELLPPITPYFVMKVGPVPHMPYQAPGDASAAAAVAAQIAAQAAANRPIRAVMLERLGPVVWHDTPAQAMAALEELEETARLWLSCMPPAHVPPLPLDATALAILQERFGCRW
jgi:3-dehydro-4-phosphotetronate decarboxylase